MSPNTDEAFLREVDEELRRDQIVGVWTQHGRWSRVAADSRYVLAPSAAGTDRGDAGPDVVT